MRSQVFKRILPYLLVVVLGFLYTHTLSPGFTWAYDGADGGDLLTAIATGGVPHPGGYPTYLLFASLFAKLPLGSLAFRGNLFSCFCMLLAIVVLYRLVYIMTGSNYVASFSTLLFGVFPLVWSQALITEVYALQTLLSLLVLYFLLPERGSIWYGFAGGIVLGLAIGNHLTAILLLPFLLLKNFVQGMSKSIPNPHQTIKHYSHLLGIRVLGLILGLSVYITIPLRARNQAPVNWGNPVDWDGFWWLVSGEMYHGRLTHFSPEYLFSGLRLWSQYLIDQMGIIGISIALFYIVVFFRPVRLHIATLYLAITYSLFAIVYFSPDSYVYLILPLFAFAVWTALGLEYLLDKLPQAVTIPRALFISASLALVAASAIWAIPEMDNSMDQTAENFAQTVLKTLPDKAIIIAPGDETLFALWYFHYAMGRRADISVISWNLSGETWYRDVLHTTYPDLKVPEVFSMQNLAQINPDRTVCMLGKNLEPNFDCLNE